MLYPIEVPEDKRLAYECRSCKFKEVVTSTDPYANCVYDHELSLSKGALMIDPDLSLDKTLSRTRSVTCPLCQHSEAVFFQNPAAGSGDIGMSLVFVCCGLRSNGLRCGHYWIQTPLKS